MIMQTGALQSGTSVLMLQGKMMEPARCSETSVYFYQMLRRHAIQNSFMQVIASVQAKKEIGGVEVHGRQWRTQEFFRGGFNKFS